MKEFLRRNPIGDHCIYTDTGLGMLLLWCASMIVLTFAGAVFIDVTDLVLRPWVLYPMVALEVVMMVILYFSLRNRFGTCVKAELTGIKLCRKEDALGTYPWSSVHEIGYTTWKMEKGEKQYTAFVALRPLTGEERFSINLSNSLNDPKQKHGDSGWIYLCSGDLERVKEAVQLMEQWKGEYAPYSR